MSERNARVFDFVITWNDHPTAGFNQYRDADVWFTRHVSESMSGVGGDADIAEDVGVIELELRDYRQGEIDLRRDRKVDGDESYVLVRSHIIRPKDRGWGGDDDGRDPVDPAPLSPVTSA